jgi:hypothetical protein
MKTEAEMVKESREKDILLYSQPCYHLIYNLTELLGIDGVQAVLNDIAASSAASDDANNQHEADSTASDA